MKASTPMSSESFGIISYSWLDYRFTPKQLHRYMRQVTGSLLDYSILKDTTSQEFNSIYRNEALNNSRTQTFFIEVQSVESFFLLLMLDYEDLEPTILFDFYILSQKFSINSLKVNNLKNKKIEKLETLNFGFRYFKLLNYLLDRSILDLPDIYTMLRIVSIITPEKKNEVFMKLIIKYYASKGLRSHSIVPGSALSETKQVTLHFESPEQAQSLITFINTYPPLTKCKATIPPIRISLVDLLSARMRSKQSPFNKIYIGMLSQAKYSAIVGKKSRTVLNMFRFKKSNFEEFEPLPTQNYIKKPSSNLSESRYKFNLLQSPTDQKQSDQSLPKG